MSSFMDNWLLRRAMSAPRGEGIDYTLLPLTFKCLTGGDLSIKNANTSYDRNFEYSLNDGAWTAFDLPKNTASKLIATLSPGDTICFRRDADNFADAQFISDSNLTFDIYGNLLSLQYGSAFNGQTELRNTSKTAFGATFRGTNVVDASKLMLTASTLSNNCYQNMFKGCTSLITAPALPATTVNRYCYAQMFEGCISLTTSPKLPALVLAASCYYAMFKDCSSLNYIECLATDANSSSNWVNGVAASGTFVKNPSMTSWSRGNDGIPRGWTVIDAT